MTAIIAEFDVVVTTPHILTEVSNLSGKLPERLHVPFRTYFAQAIATLSEQNTPAVDLSRARHFIRFGMADTAISLIAPNQFFVLTEELALYSFLSAGGVDVMNFNHIRLAA